MTFLGLIFLTCREQGTPAWQGAWEGQRKGDPREATGSESAPLGYLHPLSPNQFYQSQNKDRLWKRTKYVSLGNLFMTLNHVESKSCSVMSNSVRPRGLYSPWNSPGQNTGVCSLSLLQGIFPTQGLNPDLPHCRRILYQLSHKGSPRILEWVAYPFSSRSSGSRNRTGVSCIAGRFFTN